MQMKKLIINADDFGYSENINQAVKEGCISGAISSASLMSNMNGFNHAIKEILPQLPFLFPGFHFNIVEGKCLSHNKLLCDNNGLFNNGFIKIFAKSYDKKFLSAVEEEFRIQLETILKEGINIYHIDSHVHIHAIPNIYKLTLKLAKEYNIKYIRSQRELPYFIKDKLFNKKFPPNILKSIILNSLSKINQTKDVITNDYLIGILYTGYMDETSIIEGLKQINNDNSLTEIILHPAIITEKENTINSPRYREFLITQNNTFKEDINNLGFKFVNYAEI